MGAAKNIDQKILKDRILQGLNRAELCSYFTVSSTTLVRYIVKYNLETIWREKKALRARSKKPLKYSDADLKKAVELSRSHAEVCRKLDILPSGNAYQIYKSRCEDLGLLFEHFDNGKSNQLSRVLSAEEILVVDRKGLKRRESINALRRAMKNVGFDFSKCSCCNKSQWNNKPIPLTVDHINGISYDNRKENLRILCYNCHAQTSTFNGKNNLSENVKSSFIDEQHFSLYKKLGNEKYKLLKNSKKRLDNNLTIVNYYNKISRGERLFTDKEVERSKNIRKVERPPYHQLLQEIEELGYRGTGRKYGVSDNAIRKWVKWYGKYG